MLLFTGINKKQGILILVLYQPLPINRGSMFLVFIHMRNTNRNILGIVLKRVKIALKFFKGNLAVMVD